MRKERGQRWGRENDGGFQGNSEGSIGVKTEKGEEKVQLGERQRFGLKDNL